MKAVSRSWSESDLAAYELKRRGGVGGGAMERDSPRERNSRELVANPTPSTYCPTYRSKWEAAFAAKLDLEQKAGIILRWAYENLTMKLARGKYHRNDFLIWHRDRTIEIAQVKGYHKNLRDSLTHIKWAAQLNPWFTFTMNRREGVNWERTVVEL